MSKKTSLTLLQFALASSFVFDVPSRGGNTDTATLYRSSLNTLNDIAVNLHKQIEATPKVSFIETAAKSGELVLLEQKLDVVKLAIEFVKERNAAKAKRAELVARRNAAIIARQDKDPQGLQSASLKDVDAIIDSLDEELANLG